MKTLPLPLIYSLIGSLCFVLASPPIGIWCLSFLGTALFIYPILTKQLIRKRDYYIHFFSISFFCSLFLFHWLSYAINLRFETNPIVGWTIFLFIVTSISFVNGFVGLVFCYVINHRPKFIPETVLIFTLFVSWNFIEIRIFPWSADMFLVNQKYVLASLHVISKNAVYILFLLTTFAICLLYVNHKRRAYLIANVLILIICPSFTVFVGKTSIEKLQSKYTARQNVKVVQDNFYNYKREHPNLESKLLGEYRIKNIEELLNRSESNRSIASLSDAPWYFYGEASHFFASLETIRARFDESKGKLFAKGLHFISTFEHPFQSIGEVDTSKKYNAIALFDHQLGFIDSYHKNLRFPFNEYIPFENYIPYLGKMFSFIDKYEKGNMKVIPLPGTDQPVFVVLICFEALNRTFVQEAVSFAEHKYPGREIVLFNPASDYLFGTWMEPYQHLMLVRWMAAEQGLPFVRATGTGISEIVAPWGEVLAHTNPNEATVIEAALPLKNSYR